MRLDLSMQISGWKETLFWSHIYQPQCKLFLLWSRWRLLTSIQRKFYYRCQFASCNEYTAQIIPNLIFIVRSTCSKVGISRDRKFIVLYAAAFICCKHKGTRCTYTGKFHMVILNLDDKYSQCVHCDEAKHGISHDRNVLSYDEEWHISPTPQQIGVKWAHLFFLQRYEKGI